MKSVAEIPTAGEINEARKNMWRAMSDRAGEINEAHEAAHASAESAIECAQRCGRLLLKVKVDLVRGSFDKWVEEHCNFGRSTAYAYIKVSKSSSTSGRLESLRQALGYDKKPEPRKFEPEFPKETVSVVKAPEGATEETGADQPAVSVSSEPPVLSERWEPDEDEDAQLALAEKDYEQRVDQIMQADDGIAEAHAQLKQQSALIATLTLSRDGYLSGKNEVVKLLKKEQRKNDRLQKQLKAAQHEIDRLRERIAIKDEAA